MMQRTRHGVKSIFYIEYDHFLGLFSVRYSNENNTNMLQYYDASPCLCVRACVGSGGSIPPTAVSKLRQFRSPHICLCLSEETLKAGGPFYLVSMPGEVKYPTKGVNV